MAGSHFQGQGEGPELVFSLGDGKGRPPHSCSVAGRREKPWEEGEHTGDPALSNPVTLGDSLSSLCLGLLPSTRDILIAASPI